MIQESKRGLEVRLRTTIQMGSGKGFREWRKDWVEISSVDQCCA